jgi:hypothetical protein
MAVFLGFLSKMAKGPASKSWQEKAGPIALIPQP